MPIKKIKINKKIIESLPVTTPHIRKRGKGKIKIIKRQHVDNDELLKELMDFKTTKRASERLGELFLNLVDNFATKSKFSGYRYLEEMKSKGIEFLLKYSKGFDPTKTTNAFSYCTQIVYHAFLQVIKKENKHREEVKQYIEKYFREKNYYKRDDVLLN